MRDMLIEVKTRLDVLIAQTTGGHNDHEARIRVLELRGDPNAVDADHEHRIRALEGRDDPDVEQSKQLHDHEGRLRKLERAVWIVAGLAAALGGGLGGYISSLLGG